MEHYCKEHDAVYFQKGKMKGFAHPILDADGKETGKWCNELVYKRGEQPEPEKPAPEKLLRSEIPGPERGLWWKEIGENFRAKLFNKDEGNGKILWDLYIKQMLSSLEITLPPKEVQPTESKLVEAAKKMGAVEIKEK